MNNNLQDLLLNLNDLEKKIKILDNNIFKNKENKSDILYIYKKKIIELSIKYDEFLLDNKNNIIIDNKIKKIKNNIDLLIEYNEFINNNKRNSNINNISFINTIFLPLALITGYFGMNFSKMGNPTLKKGILSIHHAHKFVFILFLICIIVTLLLFHYNILM